MAASIEAVQQLDDIIFQLAVISLFNIFWVFPLFSKQSVTTYRVQSQLI